MLLSDTGQVASCDTTPLLTATLVSVSNMLCALGVAAGQVWDRCQAESNRSAGADADHDSQ